MKKMMMFCAMTAVLWLLAACGEEAAPPATVAPAPPVVPTAAPASAAPATTAPASSLPFVSAPLSQPSSAPMASGSVDHDEAMESAREQAEILGMLTEEELAEFATPVPLAMRRALRVNGEETELPALNKDGQIILPLRDVSWGLGYDFTILPGANARMTWTWEKEDRDFSVAFALNTTNSTISGVEIGGSVEGLEAADIHYEDGTLYATVGFVEKAFGVAITSDDTTVAVE